jgi:hypothetical protein
MRDAARQHLHRARLPAGSIDSDSAVTVGTNVLLLSATDTIVKDSFVAMVVETIVGGPRRAEAAERSTNR